MELAPFVTLLILNDSIFLSSTIWYNMSVIFFALSGSALFTLALKLLASSEIFIYYYIHLIRTILTVLENVTKKGINISTDPKLIVKTKISNQTHETLHSY
ncbi:hypothetical protein NPIRD3C_1829 [Nitrosopumilus piranensis]|uniref:Uncharacterized protein n=1 Tax=Nitrosopumilus piranensis TaxID=1582439 RepID=A0A0C5BXN7_9ARCH|nr:hypothetical protein NPIRD3C_1829 [Nitrosopumilus piranensis]